MDKLKYSDLPPFFKSFFDEAFYERLNPEAAILLITFAYISMAQSVLDWLSRQERR